MQGVFFEPSLTFQEIDRRPNWLFPLLAIIVVVTLSMLVAFERIGLDTIIRNEISDRMLNQELPEEQLDTLVEKVTSSTVAQILIYLQALVAPSLLLLCCSLLFTGALYLLGGEVHFKKIVSVSAHTFFFYYLLYSSLSCIVIFFASDPQGIDLKNPLYSNLGFAVNQEDSPALYGLASSLDLISFYHLYLLSLGLWTVSKKISRRTVAVAVIVLWALWVTAKIGIAAAFA